MKFFKKLVGWLFGIAVGLAVVLFAVAARERVMISLDPLPFSFAPRVAWVAFGALLVGFVGGAVAAWFGGRKWRRLARARKREVGNLKREVAQLSARRESALKGMARLPPVADAG